MNIGIATDHHGVKQKEKLIKYLQKKGHTIYNYGTDSEESVDYPDYAFLIGEKINEDEIELGILICGTGVGMCIASNKVRGIRCAKIDNVKEAKLSRLHNNANVISLSSYMSLTKMKDILDVFIKTRFTGEERHILRLEKVDNYFN
ncbi:MAG: RpiB/LacA/LacB family sugar-phosphate isomerase [Bacilli bacterium]|nr:RpiB/LacA/LacB family sugar-phosphate isomerase [Bacilli bacterium]MDD4282923.1 RpiB/LacA/LacB family sugar-phosphate isomerase [Bacilli bacterium]MDD4718364.1 RpiB/LacA/LacB family sugar-phosphate isomerase [Bacilli bacterium]